MTSGLSLDDHWPVIVIGGGPAGAAAATSVARAGTRVLLVERSRDEGPRTSGGGKVCGGCLNAAALRELDRMADDGAAAVRRLGQPLHGVRLVAGRRTARVPMGGSIAVGRDELDPWLRATAREAGAVVRQGVSAEVLGGIADDVPIDVALRPTDGGGVERCTAAWVIVADGLGGTALRQLPDRWRARRRDLPGQRIGIGAIVDWPSAGSGLDVRPGELVMIDGDRGYLGIVRLRDGRADVAAAVDPAAIAAAGGPRRWLAKTLASAGMAGEALVGEPAGDGFRVRGTPRLATRARCPAGAGALRVGDGLVYAEPFSGQGIAWALEGGRRAGTMVAAAMADGQADGVLAVRRAAVTRAWTSEARRQRRRQRTCRMVAAGLRTPVGGPVLAGVAGLMPAAARLGLRWIDRGPSVAGSIADRRLGATS